MNKYERKAQTTQFKRDAKSWLITACVVAFIAGVVIGFFWR